MQVNESEQKTLAGFLDADGRVVAYPTKRSKKVLVLQYLADKFEPGVRYTEKEVNALLGCWHTFGDYCLLRRELYDAFLLEREQDGSCYWLPGRKEKN